MNNRKLIIIFIIHAFTGSYGYGQTTGKAIWNSEAYSVFDNRVVEGDYVGKALSATEIVSSYPAHNKPDNMILPHWHLEKDITALPHYQSEHVLVDALYNLSLEEMEKAVEPDSTFRTGARWSGVWTRDISYSIILSMAILQPEVAKKSLMRKVKNGHIIQDTGTGGSYPVSTDRIIWATAAWEIYKVTGDLNWLRQVYPVIKKTVAADRVNCYDTRTGLVRGESSFLDWREQTYPVWMQSADIYMSEALGTNAVHYQANRILAGIALKLNEKKNADEYRHTADRIKKGINKYLWLKDKGYYGQFLYGRNHLISSRKSESLGEALCVLFGIADQKKQQSIIAHTPTMIYGIPCVYPQSAGMFNYHNNAVWPFVQSYWVLAAAKAGNQEAVLRGLSSIYRAGAFFLTNKENFVASTGDYSGTKVNSSTMLWSLSGNIAMIYKVFFGMTFNEHSLVLRPFVPAALGYKQMLTGFKYRKATLDLELSGTGNQISFIELDGRPVLRAEIPDTLTGRHRLEIRLSDKVIKSVDPPVYEAREAPKTPIVIYTPGKLSWHRIAGAITYRVLKNGLQLTLTKDTTAKIIADGAYQVIGVDQDNYESFASEPITVTASAAEQLYEIEQFAEASALPYQGFSGTGFVEIDGQKNRIINIPVNIKADGNYAVSFRYANGNGHFYDNNKCAVRTLKSGAGILGTFVFPQRGVDKWSDWGNSNSILVKLNEGHHTLSLVFAPQNENMNGDVNQAMIDYMQITKIN